MKFDVDRFFEKEIFIDILGWRDIFREFLFKPFASQMHSSKRCHDAKK